MDYGEILRKTWQIIWKFKVLWIFGFLASCGQGSGGGGGGGGGGTPSSGMQFEGDQFSRGADNFFFQIGQFLENVPVWVWVLLVIGILLFFLLLAVITLLIRTIGQIGLVRGAWLADEGVEHLNFGELLRESFHYFWRVLLFTIILTILGWVVGFILILPILFFVIFTLGCGLCCLIPLAIIVGWAVSIFVKQAVIAIVGEDLDILEGVQRAWDVIKENLGHYVVMGLILSLGAAIIGFIFAIPFFIVFMPLIIGAFSTAATETTSGLVAGGAVSLALLCIYIPIVIVLSAILQAYIDTAWTLVFRRLTGRPGATIDEEGPQEGGGQAAEITSAAEEKPARKPRRTTTGKKQEPEAEEEEKKESEG